jgi:tripartite-type tricarboxylate transporter receptor subunit TctC
MTLTRRHILQQLALGAAAYMAGAHAQQPAWPAKPVRVVVPYPAGGTTDLLARQLAEIIGKQWGQPVTVDNRPGAGGVIGADAVAKSAPDGHTLLLTLTGLVQVPSLYGSAKVPFDPLRDFAPVSELGTTPIVLVGQPGSPGFKELVAQAQAADKPMLYGTFGLGSSAHLSMETVGRAAKFKTQHVPYKGEAPLITDLLGAQVPLGIIGEMMARQHTQSGKLRALAVTGTSRAPGLPDVPTFKELGFTGAERTGWFGLLAPAGTPPAIVEKISADVHAAMDAPGFRTRMQEVAIVLRGTTPAAFTALMKEEYAYWAEVIRIADVHLE